MTLRELSKEYRRQVEALEKRMRELRQAAREAVDAAEREALLRREAALRPLLVQARDLAVLTHRYYERGYYKNAKYTL